MGLICVDVHLHEINQFSHMIIDCSAINLFAFTSVSLVLVEPPALECDLEPGPDGRLVSTEERLQRVRRGLDKGDAQVVRLGMPLTATLILLF